MVREKEVKEYNLRLCVICGKAFMTEFEDEVTCKKNCEVARMREIAERAASKLIKGE
jgi:predicted nucleic acid-binding Zn ribbon protein